MGARSTEAKGLSAALSAIPAVNALALLSGLIISGRWNLFGLWTLESTTGRSTGFLIWFGQDSNPALRVTLWTVATAATIPNESGFLLPEAMIIFGDTSLALSLAFGVALFINAWLPKCTTTEATST
jgi:hypothetical protein